MFCFYSSFAIEDLRLYPYSYSINDGVSRELWDNFYLLNWNRLCYICCIHPLYLTYQENKNFSGLQNLDLQF